MKYPVYFPLPDLHGSSPCTHSSRALRLTLLLGLLIFTPALISQQVQADEQASESVIREYSIAAGPLNIVLTRFSEVSGAFVAGSADQVAGKSSDGLNGRYSITQALNIILQGTGYVALKTADGSYVLAASKQEDDAILFSPMEIEGTALGSITEGSGSYTTGASNASTGMSLSLRETPQSITVMTHDRMSDQGLDEIAEVLEQTVGIEANTLGAMGTDSTVYYSRGFTVENYQVDGIARPAGMYGFAEETADMVAYDRVEILRGASGLMTGMGVPSASINLLRKRPTSEASAYVSAKTGSWNLYRLEGDVSNNLNKNGNVRGRLTAAYQENDSFIDREHAERQAVYGVIEADITDTTLLTMSLEYQEFENNGASRGGVPVFYSDGSETNFSRSTNTGAKWSRFTKDSLNLFTSLEHQLSESWRVKVDYEHKEGSYDETIGYVSAASIDKDTGVGGTFYAARWGADTQLDAVNINAQGGFHWLGRRHDLAFTLHHSSAKDDGPGYPGWWFGGGYNVSPINAVDFFATGEIAKPDLSSTGSSSGGEVEQTAFSSVLRMKPSDSLAVILGNRVSNWQEIEWSKSSAGVKTTNPGDEENGVLTPYAGVVFDFTKNLSAYASYTSIFEPQTNVDIDGTTLDPLEGNSYEVGMKAEYLNGRLNASAAVFRLEQQNYPVALGAGIYAPDGSIAYRSEDGAKSRGFEIELGGQLSPNWQIAAGFANASVEDNDGETLNSYIPENTLKLFTSYHLRGDLEGLILGGNVRWQSETRVESANPVTADDYVQESLMVMDVMAKYVFPENVTLTLNVNNLFDKTYYSGLGLRSRYGAPRNIYLSAKYDF